MVIPEEICRMVVSELPALLPEEGNANNPVRPRHCKVG